MFSVSVGTLFLAFICFAIASLVPPPEQSVSALSVSSEALASDDFVILMNHAFDEAAFVDVASAGGIVVSSEGNLAKVSFPQGRAAVDLLSAKSSVRAVSPNFRINKVTAPWHLDRIDQCLLPLDNSYTPPSPTAGQGVRVYIVDTGVDATHPLFGGRVNNFYTAYSTFADVDGHGTHVAGIACAAQYGVAEFCTIENVRVLDDNGSGSLSDLAAGLLAILASGQKGIINLSLGFAGHSTVLASVIHDLIAAGWVVVAAAGNEAVDACGHEPSSLPGVVSVAAVNSIDVAASFTNFGACVDGFAGGVAVTSLHVGGGTITMSGTSMSTPVVSGIAATLLQANPGATPAQITSLLITNSVKNTVLNANGSPNRIFLSLQGNQCAFSTSSATSGATSGATASSSSSSSATSSTSSSTPSAATTRCTSLAAMVAVLVALFV